MMLLVLVCSSCSKFTISNQEWCADKGPLGAHCKYTNTNDSRDIPASEWNKIAIGKDHRFGKVCSDVENFTELKGIILKLCNKTKKCTYEFKKKISAFVNNLEEEQAENYFLQNLLVEDKNNDTL